MGAYSSSQFMGLFIGGLVGGWFKGEYGNTAVFLFCAAALFSWLVLSLSMKQPRYLANLLVSVANITTAQATQMAEEIRQMTGVAECQLHFEEAVMYLKVDNQQLPREQLQQLIDRYETAASQ